jgi:hypothetical protein
VPVFVERAGKLKPLLLAPYQVCDVSGFRASFGSDKLSNPTPGGAMWPLIM